MIIEKEELKKLYVDEGKTIQRISKMYECHRRVIEKKLREYRINIRPRGSFLVDENGKTLSSKYMKGEISSGEYENIKAKSRGHENYSEYLNERAKSRGHENHNEYQNENAKKRGFKDNADYNQKMRFEKGMGTGLSMYENKNSPKYLGIVIAERILPKIFNDVKMMPQNNRGYDVICNRNLKIEVKCSTLHKDNKWIFGINKNKIADYFFMISFDNRDDLNVIHMWLIKNDSVIEKTTWNSKEFILNEKHSVSISNSKSGLKRWEKYEKTDYLDEVQKICDEFKMKEINKLLNNSD